MHPSDGIVHVLVGALRSLRIPAIISSALVLPLVILESINRRGFQEGFPVVLFGFLWLLPFAFTLIFLPLLRRLSARGRYPAVLRILPRAVLLIFIAWLWVSVTADQMPCFLGVPNCD